MKSEKYTPPSAKQIRKMVELGIDPTEATTQHRATQLINKAMVDSRKTPLRNGSNPD